MQKLIQNHLKKVLLHLYINPLEKCNLKCKICYTRKTSPILSREEILQFVSRYQCIQKLETITFCGGEVFTLKYFPQLVNQLTSSEVILVSPDNNVGTHPGSQLDSGHTSPGTVRYLASFARITEKSGIFVQIITNGTIDRLSEFNNPNMVNLIVSLDGLPLYHDHNRGTGNFAKSISFLKKARKLGFHTEIFSIVTRQNYDQIDQFEEYLNVNLASPDPSIGTRPESYGDPSTSLGMTEMQSISVTYHPRKPPTYLTHHPISSIQGETEGFDFLSAKQLREIMGNRRTFPPKNLGCYQIALVSDGRVFGCCEGTVPIGIMTDDIEDLFDKLKERLDWWENSHSGKSRPKRRDDTRMTSKCLGCSQPDFVCGIRKIFG